MVQIVNCDEEILKEIPNVIELLYELYGATTIALFAVIENDMLAFVGREGNNCVFINKDGYYRFTLDNEEKLGVLVKDGYEIYFGEDLYFVDEKSKMEYHLDLLRISEVDEQGYDGCVSYKQYNPEIDTLCELRFQHMYRENDGNPVIYGMHTEKIDCLYIDEEFKRKSKPKIGLIPKRSKYYSKVEFADDMMGYNWITIKEYGLSEFLENGSYKLQKEHSLIRYVKTQFIGLNGNYRDFWPFGEQLKIEQINELIKSYGFGIKIPWQFIDIYNGRDKLVNTIKDIVKEMKVVSEELRKNEESEKAIKLILRCEETIN